MHRGSEGPFALDTSNIFTAAKKFQANLCSLFKETEHRRVETAAATKHTNQSLHVLGVRVQDSAHKRRNGESVMGPGAAVLTSAFEPKGSCWQNTPTSEGSRASRSPNGVPQSPHISPIHAPCIPCWVPKGSPNRATLATLRWLCAEA